VAQLDSASVFGTEGYRFESYRVYFQYSQRFVGKTIPEDVFRAQFFDHKPGSYYRVTRRKAVSTMRKPRIPGYRHHKPTNQAVVTLKGKDVYLGP
jgi:hypothetical protein